MKVRKRVTLMAVAITAIFGICWGTNSVIYVLNIAKSYNIGPALLAIVDTMVLFNSAVNPFVYALFNQQFREKMKKTLSCRFSSAVRVHPKRESKIFEITESHVPRGDRFDSTLDSQITQ